MDDRTSIAGQSDGSIASSVTTVKQLTTQIQNGKSLDKDQNKQLLEIIKLLKENNEYQELKPAERKAIQKQLEKNDRNAAANWIKSFKVWDKNVERLNKALTNAFQSIDRHIQTYTQYSIRVSAALDGTQKTYASAVNNLTEAIGSTGLAKMSDVLTQMASLTERGIIANVEQNAFLMSIKDGIASTFNAANGTLLRLIKLQGEDSTTNRLVMQASLKEYLNSTYQNSQYLYEQFDTVSANLLEATSLLTSSLGNSLEATVQKWLGSLSSVGLSDQAVSSLSSALGAVGSGNLRSISEEMQNLIIMGANRVGLSYSDLLTGGLSSEQTDKLMSGMMEYLGTLSGNNVVLSEYANIFGMTVSDLKAARNALADLGNIQGSIIDSETSKLGEYLEKYNKYLNATPATLYDNLFDNWLFGMGVNVASDRGSYGLYKAGGLIGSITSSIGLSSAIGDVVNLIGPGMQLAAALGGGEGGFKVTNIVKTLTGLTKTITNLFDSPDAVAAYNKLAGVNLATGMGALADVLTDYGKKASDLAKGVSQTTSASSKSAFGDGGKVEVAISESMAAIEEAQAARTADDIYEFLSDDAVTVTPYPETMGMTLETISTYNMRTAQATEGILAFMYSKLGPYLLFESMDEANSLIQAAQSGTDETAVSLKGMYDEWLGGFGG